MEDTVDTKALLNSLCAKLDTAEILDDSAFALLVSEAMKVMRISTAEAAVYFSLDIPTSERWRRGKTAFMPDLRPEVLAFIRTRAGMLQNDL